jgi:hypothetical protein
MGITADKNFPTVLHSIEISLSQATQLNCVQCDSVEKSLILENLKTKSEFFDFEFGVDKGLNPRTLYNLASHFEL